MLRNHHLSWEQRAVQAYPNTPACVAKIQPEHALKIVCIDPQSTRDSKWFKEFSLARFACGPVEDWSLLVRRNVLNLYHQHPSDISGRAYAGVWISKDLTTENHGNWLGIKVRLCVDEKA